MPVSATRFKGKLKREIAKEAFQKLGAQATIQEVDNYFSAKYGIVNCERSMFLAERRVAQGKVPPVRRRYRQSNENKDIIGLIARVKQLAYDIGGYDKLEELISVLK